MLQLSDIHKQYTTGSFTQVALDRVSIAFRDNEFAAILGPSGSGKTTLLNIVGGLDHYDSGDLIIDGVSTKKYKDRDWDAYRNNRIGFVFQSYNLIPHQTVLANVELALTLSGVGKAERRKRALEALSKVGLQEHVAKKPGQLSGGQMQRVAIARALINDPDIVLADEPTGALDTKTSVQIMNLLKEVAKDRLVIMVTHNPELATEYATRTINLKDGVVTDDSNPYCPTPEEIAGQSSKAIRRTKMSFWTALSLSFKNLMTKKGRTFMTAFAGSIGIIGIALILALANGINAYIDSVEEETLSQYPIQITSSSLDLTSLISQMGNGHEEEERAELPENTVGVMDILTSMFGSIGANDLTTLKKTLDSAGPELTDYINAVEYKYNVIPQIYSADTSDGIRKINPDTTFSAYNATGISSSGLLSAYSSTDVFNALPANANLYLDQYDIKAGHWPEAYNECVLVLTSGGSVTDYLLYSLGLLDQDEMKAMITEFFVKGEVEVKDNSDKVFTYNDFMNLALKLVNAYEYYQYDSTYRVWVDKSSDIDYMKNLVNHGTDLKIVGIVQAKEASSISMLTSGVYYSADLTQHLMESAKNSSIVKDQLANPTIDVITGISFEEEAKQGSNSFDMSSLFTIDGDKVNTAFSIDQSKLQLDLSGLADMISAEEISGIMTAEYTPASLSALVADCAKDPDTLSALSSLIVNAVKAYQQALLFNGSLTPEAFFASTGAGYAFITNGVTAIVGTAMPVLADYMATATTSVIQQVVTLISTRTMTTVSDAVSAMMAGLPDAFVVDPEAFADAITVNVSQEQLTEIMLSFSTTSERTYADNLAAFGYASADEPYEIDLYPKDFESKASVISYLNNYNTEKQNAGLDDQVISFTDIVGALMSSVTDIIDAISAVLIAFVAISLIVSSIMIGVITYISVLERKKEIGILRATGASKRDVSHVFNAETIIEGLVAGLMGVGISALLCIPACIIVENLTNIPDIAQLPLTDALILICISVFLTFIAGTVPSGAASRKDPVEALRSE